MFSKVFFFGLLLVAFVYGQTSRQDILTIDPFTPDTDVIVIVTYSDTVYPQVGEAFTQSTRILGGERDLNLQVNGANTGRVISTGVSNGTWDVSSPSSAQSIVTMQYDGADATSTLNTQGLLGVDLTTSNADSFRLAIGTDISTTYTLKVYGQTGGVSTFDLTITPSTESTKTYFADFSRFTGNADFSNVGAIEIVIVGGDNVDTSIDLFTTSAATVPPESPSATPAPSASPAVVGFTWYTVDDDFDREPCEDEVEPKSYWVTEQNIIYYYFHRAYYEPVIIYNSAASVAPYLLGTVAALVLAF